MDTQRHARIAPSPIDWARLLSPVVRSIGGWLGGSAENGGLDSDLDLNTGSFRVCTFQSSICSKSQTNLIIIIRPTEDQISSDPNKVLISFLPPIKSSSKSPRQSQRPRQDADSTPVPNLHRQKTRLRPSLQPDLSARDGSEHRYGHTSFPADGPAVPGAADEDRTGSEQSPRTTTAAADSDSDSDPAQTQVAHTHGHGHGHGHNHNHAHLSPPASTSAKGKGRSTVPPAENADSAAGASANTAFGGGKGKVKSTSGTGGGGGVGKDNSKIWSTSGTGERERIRDFWLGLGKEGDEACGKGREGYGAGEDDGAAETYL
jgi:hypothetical protein